MTAAAVTPKKGIANSDFEAEIKALQAVLEPTWSVSFAAGAANVCTITIQAKDGVGNNRAAIVDFEMFMTTDIAGAALTGTAYSTGIAATTGAVLTALTANKHLKVVTDATGKAVLTLTDTGKPATERVAIVKPSGQLYVSGVTGAAFG